MKYLGIVKYIDKERWEERAFHGQTAHEVIELIERKTLDCDVIKLTVRKVE